MPAYYPGNAIPAPGYSKNPLITTDEELLFSTKAYLQKGVTLESGQGVLLYGTALKQNPATKKYVRATTAATTAGILRKTVDTGTDTAGQVWLANILYQGTLQLAAVSAANSGFSVATITGAHVDAVAGFFRF